MPHQSIIGYSPLMLDVSVRSQLPVDEYLLALSRIRVRCGERLETHDQREFRHILHQLENTTPEYLVRQPGCSIGSTIIASFPAFNPEYDIPASLMIVEGRSTPFINDEFYRQLATKQLPWQAILTDGSSSICFVSYHQEIPESTFIVLNDPKLQAPIDPAAQPNTLAWLSLFEINDRFFNLESTSLLQNNTSLAIGLGDLSVIREDNWKSIKQLIDAGVVTYLFGNMSEFRRLTTHGDSASPRQVISDMQTLSQTSKTVFLITDGVNGQFAVQAGSVFHEEASTDLNIVNTNGAGDAAAGGFVSTHFATGNAKLALEFAHRQADRVLVTDRGSL